MKLLKSKKGFTLAELLIVVAIVAVLVSIGVPVFVSRLENARRTVCEANRRSAKAILGTIVISQDDIADNITDGVKWEDIYTSLKNSGYQIDEEICPKGGAIKITRNGSSVNLSCSIHNGAGGSGESGDSGRNDWMSNEESATDILTQLINEFESPAYHTGEEKAFMAAYMKKAEENGGLMEISAAEVLNKFSDPDNSLYKVNNDEQLVWVGSRVFFDGKEQDLLVATSKSAASSNLQKGFLFYYGGNYYRSTNIMSWNNAYDYASLTQGYSKRDDSFDKFLEEHNWELVQ